MTPPSTVAVDTSKPASARTSAAARALCRRTGRLERLQENLAATTIPLSADDVADLDTLTRSIPVHGNRDGDAALAFVGL